MVELEQLTEYRFYKLIPEYKNKCDNIVENIYHRVNPSNAEKKFCYQLLKLHMIEDSINLICPSCHKQYDIKRICNICETSTTFDDVTCDVCEPKVIDIATWRIGIEEAGKAIKKINRAFKNDLINEVDWKTALELNRDELIRCEKNLEREGISLQSTN